MSLPPSALVRRSGFGLFSNPFVPVCIPVLCGARIVAGAGASSFLNSFWGGACMEAP